MSALRREAHPLVRAVSLRQLAQLWAPRRADFPSVDEQWRFRRGRADTSVTVSLKQVEFRVPEAQFPVPGLLPIPVPEVLDKLSQLPDPAHNQDHAASSKEPATAWDG